MSTLLNTVETYQSLQPFESVEQLNQNTIAIREMYSDQLTPSTIQVLDVLHRYACKYPGVCYLSKNNIAEMVDVTRRTVIRACKQLEDLGIIKQYELKRHNGDKRQSSNAIVFEYVQNTNESQTNADENNNVTPSCHTKEALTNTHLNSSNTLDTSTRVLDKKQAVNVDSVDNHKELKIVKADIKRGLRDKMPTYLYDILSPYFNLDDLYKAYGALIRGKASIDKSIVFEINESLYSDAILSVINAYKRGKVRNLFAVLYTAAQETSAQIYRLRNRENVYNWLL